MKKISNLTLLFTLLISINSYSAEYKEDPEICPITVNELVKKINLTHVAGKEYYKRIKENCKSGVYQFYSLIRYYNSQSLPSNYKEELYNEFITINSELTAANNKGLDGCSEFQSIIDNNKDKLINDCKNRVFRDDRIALISNYPAKGINLDIKKIYSGNKAIDYINEIIDNYNLKLCVKENCGIVFSLILGSSSIPKQYQRLAQMLIIAFDGNPSYKKLISVRTYTKYESDKDIYLNKLANDRSFACNEIKNYIDNVLNKTGKINIEKLCN